MVGITELLGILFVELFGEVEVGVDLEGERLAEGEDLHHETRYINVRIELCSPLVKTEFPAQIDPTRTCPPVAGSS